MYFVYEEVDPRTNITGYLGISNNPNARHQQHLNDISGDSAKSVWIAELLSLGLEPKMRIIEIVDTEEEGLVREKHWITTYNSRGIKLTNVVHTHNERKARHPASTPVRNVFESYTDMIERHWQQILEEEMRDHPDLASDTEVMLQLFVATYHYGHEPMDIEKKLLKDWAYEKWQSIEHQYDSTWDYLEQEAV